MIVAGFVLLGLLAVLFGLGSYVLGDRSLTRTAVARALYRQRQTELADEELDTDVLEALRSEAGRALLQDEQDEQDEDQDSATATSSEQVDLREPSRLLVVCMALLVPIVALLIYFSTAHT